MIKLADFQQRVVENTTRFRSVKGVADLAAAEATQHVDTAFVMLADESASDNDTMMAVRQQATIGVAVVLAITNRRDNTGSDGMDEIETARGEVRRALLGWEPPGAVGMVTYRRGRLLNFNNATLWWQDEYQVPAMLLADFSE